MPDHIRMLQLTINYDKFECVWCACRGTSTNTCSHSSLRVMPAGYVTVPELLICVPCGTTGLLQGPARPHARISTSHARAQHTVMLQGTAFPAQMQLDPWRGSTQGLVDPM
jgi:hypothetical protein